MRTAASGRTKATATATMPSHIVGATAAAANRFAGSETRDSRPKWARSKGPPPANGAAHDSWEDLAAPDWLLAAVSEKLMPPMNRTDGD